MNQEILGVEKAIEESNTQLVTFNNNIRDIDWEIFDWLEERISRITDEAQFLVDLMSNDQLYEDDGRLTNLGEATNGLYAIQYETLMRQAQDYAEERIKLEREIAKDPANKTLVERYEELVDAQQDAINGAEDMKNAVRDLVENGITKHLEFLDELINKYTELMDKEKEAYEYSKNIEKQVENINNLEKMLNAYMGDDSEETRKIRQQTANQLEEARQQLEETEWDKMISETKELLTDMRDEYEEVLMARLDDVDALMRDMIDTANAQGDNISNTIKSVAKDTGYTLTDELKGILSSDTIASGFKASFDNYATSTSSILTDIKNYVANIADQTTNPVVNEKDITSTGQASSGSKATGNTAASGGGTSNKKPTINTVRNGINYGSIFDLEYYMNKYPDLVQAFGNNYDDYLTHFIDFGMKEGRRASEKFDVNYYKSKYGDLQAAFGNDLAKYYQHYLTYGIKEGRQASKTYGNYNYNGLDYSAIFDPKYYSNKYPDLKKAFGDDAGELFNHFINFGMKEGRQASSTFNPETYKKRYADLQAAFGNDWMRYYAHYLLYGKNEGRKAYAKGSRRIPNDQFAWTQENGTEIIYRASDGAMLTPLGTGDMVFTNEMSQRLFDLAKTNIPGNNNAIPKVSSRFGNNVTNQNAISFTLPAVKNYDEFVNAMKRDSKFAGFIQEITFGQANGNNSLKKYNY